MLCNKLLNATNTAQLLLEDWVEYEDVVLKVRNYLDWELSGEVLDEIAERVVSDAVRNLRN